MLFDHFLGANKKVMRPYRPHHLKIFKNKLRRNA